MRITVSRGSLLRFRACTAFALLHCSSFPVRWRGQAHGRKTFCFACSLAADGGGDVHGHVDAAAAVAHDRARHGLPQDDPRGHPRAGRRRLAQLHGQRVRAPRVDRLPQARPLDAQPVRQPDSLARKQCKCSQLCGGCPNTTTTIMGAGECSSGCMFARMCLPCA